MVKRNTTLVIEDELITLAKSAQINISSLVNSILEVELEIKSKKDEIDPIIQLKTMNVRLTSEIKKLTKELDKLKETDKKDKTILWR